MADTTKLDLVRVIYLFSIIGSCMISDVKGHGRLIEPPSRASAWRYGFDTPPNYNDHELYCGGYTTQWAKNEGKCGECGDAYNLQKPRPHEYGGKYGQGVIVRSYNPGSEMTIRVELTASHMGYFEFRLCDNIKADQSCLDKHLLKLMGGTPSIPHPNDLETRFYPRNGSRIYEIKAQLPKKMECSSCVLQWRYVAGNNWGICEDGNGAVGCGPQEEFRACSDIQIGEGKGSQQPSRPSKPSIRPKPSVPPQGTDVTVEPVPGTGENEIPQGPSYMGPVVALFSLFLVLCGFAAIYLYHYHGKRFKLFMRWNKNKPSQTNAMPTHHQVVPIPPAPTENPPVPPPRTRRPPQITPSNIVIVILSLISLIEAQSSPCPNYFRYESDGYQTYGVIEVPPVQLGTNLNLNVQLSIGAKLPNNYYGSLELLGSQNAALQNILSGRNILYKVTFPLQRPLPKLTQILYNGKLICSGYPEQSGYVTTIKLQHTLKTQNQHNPNQGSHHFTQQNNFGVSSRPILSNNNYAPQNSGANQIQEFEIVLSPEGEVSVRPPSYQNTVVNSKPLSPTVHEIEIVIADSTSRPQQVYPSTSVGLSTTEPPFSTKPTTTTTTTTTTMRPTTTTTTRQTTTSRTTTTTERYESSTENVTTAVPMNSEKPSSTSNLDELLEELYGTHLESLFNNSTESFSEETLHDDVCGKPIISGNPLVLSGAPTTRGEFPWLTAIYVKKKKSLNFHCGSSLISDKVIITAAHCMKPDDFDVLSVDEIVVFVGRNNIDDWTEQGYITPKVRKVIVHPQYKEKDQFNYDADIALITLKQTIKFTQYVRPICLWDGSTKITEIISQVGIVVGWGRDEAGSVTSTPNKVEMPIVSESTCLRSHESYRYLTSNRTFCAGRRDGAGPCNGDSGGPLALFKNGRWYIRGIVSTSLYDTETNSCDVKNYVVFTDIAQFLPWINSYL
uniref:CSON009299 protein n=1 Tax=Culicoides sonorensis TaxID=179676 RepID=A0A336M0I6_CULSO